MTDRDMGAEGRNIPIGDVLDAVKALKLAYDEAMTGNQNSATLFLQVALSLQPQIEGYDKKSLLPDDLDIANSPVGEIKLALQRPDAFSEPYPNQGYFWTPEWQAQEREAEIELAQGLGTSYSSVEELFREI